MDKDLVVINRDSNSNSSEANGDYESSNKSDFNSLSKNNNTNIDDGGYSSPNFNDDYGEEEDYSQGNYYKDDFNDYYSKGNVYNNDFTEDYPGVNSSFKQKVYNDIKNIYNSESNKEDDILRNLSINIDSSKQFFDIIKDEVEYEPGRVLFKFNSLKPVYNKENSSSPLYFIIALIILFLLPEINETIAILYFLIGFFGIFFICFREAIKYIYSSITTNYLVLDYNNNEFYFESRNIFGNKDKRLFRFEDVVDIGISYDYRKSSNTSSINNAIFETYKIYLLLANGEVFKFLESDKFSIDIFKNYSRIAKNLSFAIKRHYFYNTNQEELYIAKNDNNEIYFTTEKDSSDDFIICDQNSIKKYSDSDIDITGGFLALLINKSLTLFLMLIICLFFFILIIFLLSLI